MATFAKTILSGSTDGRGILVSATSSPGTLIHTGSSTSTDLHEVWLYAMNTSVAITKLTIQWGSTSTPQDDIELSIQPESGLTIIAPGLLIKGNATPLVVRAYAATTNFITIHGYVNTIV